MRRALVAAASIGALLTGPAGAQSTWQEYTYPDQQCAVPFLVEPMRQTKTFTAPDGTTVNETIYSVRQDTAVFQLAVTLGSEGETKASPP
jgi:hypothetical protein